MRRRAMRAALVAALLVGPIACNGILGIDSPTLVEGGASSGDAKAHDGEARRDGAAETGAHDATKDARNDAGRDAATDAARDAKADVRLDGGGTTDAVADGPRPGDAAFDGNCTCSSDACAPITVVSNIVGQVSGLVVAPGGLYFSNDVDEPLHGVVEFVRFGHGIAPIAADASFPGAMAIAGSDLFWTDTIVAQINTCDLPSGEPRNFIQGDPLPGGSLLVGNGASIFWTDGTGVRACPVIGCDGGASLGGTEASQLAANDAGALWSVPSTSPALTRVFSCATATCGATEAEVLTQEAGISLLATTRTNLYWVSGNTISTCPMSNGLGPCSGPPTALATTSVGSPVSQLAVDSTALYWSDSQEGLIVKVPLDGSALVTLVSGSANLGEIAVGPTCVFWAGQDGDAGVLKAIAK
jgi:hypothetical protein